MCLSPTGDSKEESKLLVARPVVCVFSEPTFRSEIVTQEIIGKPIKVHESKNGWLRCTLCDGYSGWIPSSAVCDDKVFRATHFVSKRFARANLEGRNVMIMPFGSYVDVESIEGRRCLVRLPGMASCDMNLGDLKPISFLPYRLSMFKSILKEVIGTTYLWGGKSTFGFDCSGLVQFIYELLGIKLPRDSSQQAVVGEEVCTLASLEPFDLIFFASSGKIDHVAIHLGDLEIFHASGFVKIESLNPASLRFRKDLADKVSCLRRLRVDRL